MSLSQEPHACKDYLLHRYHMFGTKPCHQSQKANLFRVWSTNLRKSKDQTIQTSLAQSKIAIHVSHSSQLFSVLDSPQLPLLSHSLHHPSVKEIANAKCTLPMHFTLFLIKFLLFYLTHLKKAILQAKTFFFYVHLFFLES